MLMSINNVFSCTSPDNSLYTNTFEHTEKKHGLKNKMQSHIPVIPEAWEAKTGGYGVQSQPQQFN